MDRCMFVATLPLKSLLILGRRYLKCIDRFYQNYVSCWITGGSKPLPPIQPLDKLHPARAIELYILITPSRRQIPPPTRAPTCFRQHFALQHVHRCQPNIPADRGGHQAVLHGGVRELGQDYHEPLLPSQHGGAQPCLPVQSRSRWEEVSVREQ